MAAGATTFSGYWQTVVEWYERNGRVADETELQRLYNLRHR
jgi:hypothetical protein